MKMECPYCYYEIKAENGDSCKFCSRSLRPLPLPNKFIGFPLDELEFFAQTWGYEIRKTKEDGRNFICTRDYHLDRINVELEKGLITRVNIG